MDAILALAERASDVDESANGSPSYAADGEIMMNDDDGDDEALDIFDAGDLASLRRRLKADLKDHERERALYEEAVDKGLKLDALVASASGASALTSYRATESYTDVSAARSRSAIHFWAYRCASVVAGAASIATILAESTIHGRLPNLSIVSWALHLAAEQGGSFLVAATCMVCLAYPCTCAYYSLYRLGRFAFYRTVPRHTDAYSLCTSALLLTRFAAPLAFNFMAAIALPEGDGEAKTVSDTVFYTEFGKLMMSQPLIGWRFTVFAPLALLPYCLVVLLGLFNPLVRLLDRDRGLAFEDDWEGSEVARGRRLLRAEVDLLRQGLPLGSAARTRRVATGSLAMPSMVGRPRISLPTADDSSMGPGSWWQRFFSHPVKGASPPPVPSMPSPAQAVRARLLATVRGGGSDTPERQALLGDEAHSPASSIGSLTDVIRPGTDPDTLFGRLEGRTGPAGPWKT